MMLKRKLYQSGGSSYIISIPKEWIEAQKLKSGDSVLLDVQRNYILVEPELKSRVLREILIQGDKSKDAGQLQRKIIANYLAGYDILRIKFDDHNLKLKEKAKETLEFLMGVEVIEDLGEHLTVQTFIDYTKLPVQKVVERVSGIIRGMLEDINEFLLTGDADLAERVMERETEVDRMYFLAVRQLKGAVQYRRIAKKIQIEHQRDILGLRLIIKSLERISDHAQSISENFIKLCEIQEGSKGSSGIVEVSQVALKIYANTIQAALEFDEEKAEAVFNDLDEVKELINEETNQILKGIGDVESAVLTRSILESFYRITRYCSDIAEIVINMAAEVPERRQSMKPKP